jgi:hypothetical protein
MENTLLDLNNYLFAEIERLDDEELDDEALQKEISRARAITGIASQVVANAGVVLKAALMKKEYGSDVPALIGDGKNTAHKKE